MRALGAVLVVSVLLAGCGRKDKFADLRICGQAATERGRVIDRSEFIESCMEAYGFEIAYKASDLPGCTQTSVAFARPNSKPVVIHSPDSENERCYAPHN
jgi:hypothetical protein